ncbi:2-hydroxychromene-2-carboxylate isomerase [Oceanibacterium hippocampi]|uniref:2-hydroxychromene-2-carboxylate isomerase n=1 Tax=Oceanibacterium hippocampi TaxID=745714 RepID=A0A1Y5R8K6_9PROT|nr:2-hydroxychromene-2-carboxylate isomerase [Oceanibacterium hippocampi]SLN11602.1 2-hydroxychromene-2-carboxylate isomerase [Oceanibacterium hippocampi]
MIIDYYFALSSPWSFLGCQRLRDIAGRNGADIVAKATSIGKVFGVSGGLPLAKRPKQRQDYRIQELKRWRDYLDIPINLHPAHFPVDENLAARTVTAARIAGKDPLALALGFHKAIWIEERDISDRAEIAAIIDATIGGSAELMNAAEGETVTAAYEADTQDAIDQGVFGAPTYVVDGELFWGQDRLDFLERKLQGRKK